MLNTSYCLSPSLGRCRDTPNKLTPWPAAPINSTYQSSLSPPPAPSRIKDKLHLDPMTSYIQTQEVNPVCLKSLMPSPQWATILCHQHCSKHLPPAVFPSQTATPAEASFTPWFSFKHPTIHTTMLRSDVRQDTRRAPEYFARNICHQLYDIPAAANRPRVHSLPISTRVLQLLSPYLKLQANIPSPMNNINKQT